jgi:predicted nucleic-acid-binding Zn-ribbon protein
MGLCTQEAETVQVLGRDLRCEVCHHTAFFYQSAQLHGAVASFFDIEWPAGRTATCVICAKCGYIHWFMPVSDDSPASTVA